MTKTRRPRVAAIGLDRRQAASIAPLCGQLRPAVTLSEYLNRYSWTETDVIVSSALDWDMVSSSVDLMNIGPAEFRWSDRYVLNYSRRHHYVSTDITNTERELAVPSACPDLYKPLAAELSRLLGQAAAPPAVWSTSRKDGTTLIATTSGRRVALRLVLPSRSEESGGEPSSPIALLLPRVSNLAAWFRAFLWEIHESDPSRVPHAPPRLSQPSDWYTPEERVLADGISRIESEVERLSTERGQLQTKLAAERQRADIGIRRALWADGDDLTAAAQDMLIDLGFEVRDMDAELRQGESKHEDLRLTLQGNPGWQALVEVKGYTSGTRTNDARQIREHRDRYIEEEGSTPDLTVWLANPFRTMEPSSRPAPDQNVENAAATIDALHVLVPDLYRQWALVAAGILDGETVIQSLANADPGLWGPPAPASGN